MEASEDLYPITIGANAIELRIHGVSGTPPEDLLRGYPIRVAGDDRSGFYRTADKVGADSGFVEAYSWGGLTSASRLTALWLLLLPFALINLTGWMRTTPAAGIRGRLHAVVSRWLAMISTSLVAIAAFSALWTLMSGGPPTWTERWEPATRWWPGNASAALTAATFLSAAVILMLFAISGVARKRFEAAGVDDGTVDLDIAAAPGNLTALWNQPEFVKLLSLAHGGLGLALITFLSIQSHVAQTSGTDWRQIASIGALAAGVSALGTPVAMLVLSTTLTRILSRVAWWVGLASWVVVLVGVTTVGVSDPESVIEATFIAILVCGVAFVALLGFLGGANSATFGIWALVVVTSVGSGLALFSGGDTGPSQSVSLAAALFVIAGLVTAATFVFVWNPLFSDDEGEPQRAPVRLRAAVALAPAILRGVAILLFGFVAIVLIAVVAAVIGDRTAESVLEPLADPIGWVGWATLFTFLVILLLRPRRLGLTAGLIAAVALISWFVYQLAPYQRNVEAARNFSDWFIQASQFAALTAPIIAAGWFVFRASSGRNIRKAVGVFWDLANYWPRWFHPWAPPPYTEVTVFELRDRIAALAADPSVEHVVISAHSQGAVIAVPAIALPGIVEKARLLSYGCLLGRHYSWLFPQFFNPERFASTCAAVGGNWQNLYRITDPLGAEVPVSEGNDCPINVTADWTRDGLLFTHSNYQYSPQYQPALNALAPGGNRPV